MAVAGALLTSEPQSLVPPSSRAAIEAALDTLRARKVIWAALPLLEKIDLLRHLRRSFQDVAEEWAAACQRAEGLSPEDPRSGEEWIVGPYFVQRNLRLLQESLVGISLHAAPRIPGPVRALPDGRAAAQVFPYDLWDRLFYPGVTGEVWMQEGVRPDDVAATQAVAYRDKVPRGGVAVVLSAGNVSSIGPMDALYKLFVDNEVVAFKTHRVNDFLGPLMERGFRPLIEGGYLRIVYGGREEGAYLCEHPAVDSIHITGSDKTFEAIVFGPGSEGARRKAEGRPRLDKRITSELGNISPLIVVPGHWAPDDVAYQAESIATTLTNNAAFNCNATRILVLHREWPQREALVAALRAVLRRTPPRRAFYPGAEERFARFLDAHPDGERFGEPGPGELPWLLLPELDPEDRDEIAFTTESFCSVCGIVELSAPSTAAFLERATEFCNERLWGTLNVTLVVDAATQAAPESGAALERAIAELRYGTVALNIWAAAGYGLVVTPWGAYPGHTWEDIQSGQGLVHNTQMFSRVEKNVIRAPFRARPKPLWFVGHRTAHRLGPRITAFEAAPALRKLPAIFSLALQA